MTGKFHGTVTGVVERHSSIQHSIPLPVAQVHEHGSVTKKYFKRCVRVAFNE